MHFGLVETKIWKFSKTLLWFGGHFVKLAKYWQSGSHSMRISKERRTYFMLPNSHSKFCCKHIQMQTNQPPEHANIFENCHLNDWTVEHDPLAQSLLGYVFSNWRACFQVLSHYGYEMMLYGAMDACRHFIITNQDLNNSLVTE